MSNISNAGIRKQIGDFLQNNLPFMRQKEYTEKDIERKNKKCLELYD